jgi:hypothetical protein
LVLRPNGPTEHSPGLRPAGRWPGIGRCKSHRALKGRRSPMAMERGHAKRWTLWRGFGIARSFSCAPFRAQMERLGGRSRGIGLWPQPRAMLGRPVGPRRGSPGLGRRADFQSAETSEQNMGQSRAGSADDRHFLRAECPRAGVSQVGREGSMRLGPRTQSSGQSIDCAAKHPVSILDTKAVNLHRILVIALVYEYKVVEILFCLPEFTR